MFLKFATQAERKAIGGSYFIEIAYCNAPNFCEVEHWSPDSLYIHGDNDNAFCEQYSGIFGVGVYANGQSGPMDLCGINYYSSEQVSEILFKLDIKRPNGCEPLREWLGHAENGFYILGL